MQYQWQHFMLQAAQAEGEPLYRRKRQSRESRESSRDSSLNAAKSITFDNSAEEDDSSFIGPTTRRQWSELYSSSKSPSQNGIQKENRDGEVNIPPCNNAVHVVRSGFCYMPTSNPFCPSHTES